MELLLDFDKLKQVIDATPEAKPILDGKTEGFKHLFEKVYLALLGDIDSEYVNLNVDIGRFDFDDLILFDNFLSEKCDDNGNSPVLLLDRVFSKLTPINKPTVFI